MEERVRSLEDWRLEMRTGLRLMRAIATAIFGVSVLSAVASIISIVLLLSGHP